LICFCDSSRRDKSQLCIIEDDSDLRAIENSGFYHGLYYVIGAKNEIKINQNVREIIIATNPTGEGDLLALKIKKALTDKNIKITRLGQGLSIGSEIEYADPRTLESALENRREI